MCASPLSFLRAGPPPPKVALLPDTLFFTRSVPVTAGATQPEAAAQVELALEAMAPFPLNQLYFGWFWLPGAENALVFAAYRRRFTSEQAAMWEGAELVLPSFAAVLGAADVQPATTVVLDSLECITAVHWEASPVPTRVLCKPLDLEAPEETRAQAREELLRSFDGSKTVIDLQAPLAADPERSDREIVFRSGGFVSRLPTTLNSALDVRDKEELAALRNAHKRDVILWRVAVGAVAALFLLGVGEIALVGGGMWQKVRVGLHDAQKPRVDKIIAAHELTNRIEELSTKRLKPLEMVTMLVGENGEKKPDDIQFTRVQADQSRGLYTLFIEGRTNNPSQINVWSEALRKLPQCQSVDPQMGGMNNQQASFTLTVVFKPDALNVTEGLKVSSR